MARKSDRRTTIIQYPLLSLKDEMSIVLEKFPLVGFKWRFTNSPAGKAKLAITNQRSDKHAIVE